MDDEKNTNIEDGIECEGVDIESDIVKSKKISFIDKYKKIIIFLSIFIISLVLIFLEYETNYNISVDDFSICEHSDEVKYKAQESLFVMGLVMTNDYNNGNYSFTDIAYRKEEFIKSKEFLTNEVCCNKYNFKKLFKKYKIEEFEDILKMNSDEIEEFEAIIEDIFIQNYLY